MLYLTALFLPPSTFATQCWLKSLLPFSHSSVVVCFWIYELAWEQTLHWSRTTLRTRLLAASDRELDWGFLQRWESFSWLVYSWLVAAALTLKINRVVRSHSSTILSLLTVVTKQSFQVVTNWKSTIDTNVHDRIWQRLFLYWFGCRPF